ncbi:hypothetical protein C1645_834210 [Glomus cerebriforme]|uniref:Arrestin-like N-terminal domain-containing protein n=1 Tax=Glomus cerebriforme TaxID=658196 RepID=A0A397SGU0_9GLOM|nr:hypothetical protein C1645_834210 [Glomus cerebriforme]
MSLGNSENILSHTSNKLKIKLIESTIILHGSPEDSLGCFLRGELILNLTKPTKIKKIELTFLGKIRLLIPRVEGEITSSNNFEEREIISHTWTFLNKKQCLSNDSDSTSSHSIRSNKSLASRLFHSFSSKKSSSDSNRLSKYHILKKGTYTYPFELFLPGTLPESINTNVGRITYKLSAKVLKSGVFTKLKKSQYVTILRTITDEWNQGKVISNEWKNICKYEISFFKKAFPIGDCIKIELKLIPKDKDKYELQYLNIDLVEKSVYNLATNPRVTSQEKIICGIKINDFIEEWIDNDSTNNYSSHIFKFSENNLKQDDEIKQDEIEQDEIKQNDEIKQDEIKQKDSKELCYHETISFRLPNSQYLIHPTYASDPITISHNLKILFCLKVHSPNRNFSQPKFKKFTLIIPITIIASKCKDDILPLYYESDNDDDSIISKTSWDEISLDDVSLPPSYESSICGSQNNSSVNLGVYLNE